MVAYKPIDMNNLKRCNSTFIVLKSGFSSWIVGCNAHTLSTLFVRIPIYSLREMHMKGNVLDFSIQKGGGLILGDDGYITDMSCNHQCHGTLCISAILQATYWIIAVDTPCPLLTWFKNSSVKGNEIENKNSGALNGYQYLGTQQYGGCGTEIRHMPNWWKRKNYI